MENCNPDMGVCVQEYHKWKASLDYIILLRRRKRQKGRKRKENLGPEIPSLSGTFRDQMLFHTASLL